MTCEKCDAEIGADSRFCASCGSKVTRPSEGAASTAGVVLDYDRRNSRGLISGSDGYRYPFNIEDWNAEHMPRSGASVDFIAKAGEATEIYASARSAAEAESFGNSKKFICGMLAIFLGVFGIHKFYLNSISKGNAYSTPAVMMLGAGTIGWVLVFPGLASLVIGVVEGVIYLTKSEEDFRQTYLIDQHPWF